MLGIWGKSPTKKNQVKLHLSKGLALAVALLTIGMTLNLRLLLAQLDHQGFLVKVVGLVILGLKLVKLLVYLA